MVPNLELAFKIIRPIIFPAIKKISFPQSRNFSTIKELFHSQGTFPKSKKLFHSQGTFPQSCKFYTIRELLHSRENFSQFRKCSTK